MDPAAPPPASDGTASPPVRGAWRLWLYGLAMLGPAGYFARRYPLRGNADELVDIGKMARYEVGEFVGYVGGLAVLFALYLLALRESRRLPVGRALPAVFGCGATLAAVFAWMYPVNAIDLFIYAVRSRLWTEHGANPLAAFPRDYQRVDPLMRFASREWSDEVSPYGPLWNVVAAPITALTDDRMTADDSVMLALVGFKLLAVASVLVGAWAIARTLAAWRPTDAATGALFYAWNPLVLWEGIGNGHNDTLLVVPLLLALLAWAKRRDGLVLPLLVVATLIKYVTVLLLPLAAIVLWRRADTWPARRRLVLQSAGLSALAAHVAFVPFYDLGAVRDSIAAQGDIFLTSPAAMAIGLLHEDYPVAEIKHWARVVGYGVLLATLAALALAAWTRPDRLPRWCFEALFVFLLVATWNFRGWYLIWPVALAGLLPWGWPAARMVAWSAGGLAGYALFIWGWEWWGADFYTVQNAAVPLMTGSALLLTLAEAVSLVRSRIRSGALAQRMTTTQDVIQVDG